MTAEKALTVKENLSKIEYLALYFFTYSFIGWLTETSYALYELGKFTNRGFLYMPICPIYGFGAIILLIFLSKYKKKSLKLFILSGIIFSVFEYIVGFALDALFAAKWWDYTNEFFNLNGRISILFSLVWGIFALIFINHIHPFIKSKLDKLLNKIPYRLKYYIVRLLLILLIVDTILSSITYLGKM